MYMKWYCCLFLFIIQIFDIWLPAKAADFFINKIQIDGLQNIPTTTTLSYLPIQVGSKISERDYPLIVRSLFKTGFFSNIEISTQGTTLIVSVVEKPIIAEINLSGNTVISSDEIKKIMQHHNLEEGLFFDKVALDKVKKIILQEYYNKGYCFSNITSSISNLEKQRVIITLQIIEGKLSRIKQINIIGNQAFSTTKLLKQLQLSPTGLFSFFNKEDQYSKHKFDIDLENLRSFYMDHGYLKFKIESTQVTFTPDKKGVNIIINVVEGLPYLVQGVQLNSTDIIHTQAIQNLINSHNISGKIFIRNQIAKIIRKIRDYLGEHGYLFPVISTTTKLDDTNHQVNLTFTVDPGKLIYVRRINLKGNIRTKDIVLRRELRQMEGSIVSTKNLERSKKNLQKLDYLENVDVEIITVPDTNNQIDINYQVVERSPGSVMVGLGYGQESGLLLNLSLVQNNFLGTGNFIGMMLNHSEIGKNYSLSFNNPYYTKDGVALGYKLYYRDINGLNTARYIKNAFGGQITFGFPLNEFDVLRISSGYEHIWINTTIGTPLSILEYLENNGDKYNQIKIDASWSHDTRDRLLFPNNGSINQISVEFAIPGISDAEFYKLNYRITKYYLLNQWTTGSISGEVGYGDGYSHASNLPFFENFYSGGLRSVRGFKSNTLGPHYTNNDPSGGAFKVLASSQLIFPVPFIENSENMRVTAFLDTGNVFSNLENFDAKQLRYSAGISGSWLSPLGPLVLSVAIPLNAVVGDQKENFQFSFGIPLN